ncbi:hypothetical protein C8Q77DRAFT_1152830 [Trametes polyzona]|nr:hypothetical protein C8Q77DRAFT_1152830 [Trametes polyzona]
MFLDDTPRSPAPTALPSVMAHVPPRVVIQPLFIDKLARDFALEEHHIVHLHTFAKVGSKGAGLAVADLATRVYMLGAVFAQSVERKQAAAAAASGLEDLPALFNDLKIRLEDGFLLTAQQRANILAITQNIIYHPHQLTFKILFKDVEKELEKQKDILRLSNIYGNPYREKQLNKLVRRVCSNVRNTYRADICDSIAGTKRASLKDFSWKSAWKYKLGGPGDKLDVSYQAHNALLRRFALDNPTLRGAAENEDVEAARGDDTEETEDTPPPPAKRKRTTRAGPKPRPAKGEDFWARVDEHFASKIRDWGPKITSDAWKSYLEQIIRQDEQIFPHAADLAMTFSSSTSMPTVSSSSSLSYVTGMSSASTSEVGSAPSASHATTAMANDDLFDLL